MKIKKHLPKYKYLLETYCRISFLFILNMYNKKRKILSKYAPLAGLQ